MLLAAKQKERYLQAFLLGLLLSGIFLGMYMVLDRGYFLYYGDFNVQQIPFYRLAHDAVRSGNIGWNWNTDLGANFIGSYSFYMLGSPFFWLTLLFPSAAVPYLMGPLLMLKFACASLTAYCYMRRFTRTTYAALFGALLYAFSGFSVYNVFFNHFHEAIVFFPVLLLAFELLVTENRRGLFAAAVAICAISNYFFFCGMVVFCIIYWLIKVVSHAWKMTLKRFGWIAFEAVIGVMTAAAILLPSYLAISGMSRVNGYLVGWDALIYNEKQVFYNILQSMFFPPDNPARLVFFPNNEFQWSSMSAWLPLIGMTGVIAWLQNKKRTWQKRILTTCLVMALVPFLNSAFYVFNYSYYARWFYMPILIMALVSAQALEEPDIDWVSAFRWSLGITVAITLAVGLMPSVHTVEDGFSSFGIFKNANTDDPNLEYYTVRFWIECALAIVSLVAMLIILKLRKGFKKRRKATLGKRIHTINMRSTRFWQTAISALCVVTVLYAGIHIGWGKTHSNTSDFLIDNMIRGSIDLDINDGERIDVYDGMDNTAMYMGYPSIQAFHSIVPVSVFDYYDYIGVDRSVGSRPETSEYRIRGLLSVRYLIDLKDEGLDFVEGDEATTGTMPGWSYLKTENDHDVYVNDFYIPYGFTYDKCISYDTVDAQYRSFRSAVMLKAMLLTDEQIKKYPTLMQEVTDDSLYSAGSFDAQGYLNDCEKLRATSAGNTLKIDNKGFTAEVELDTENLVFYSVPYDDGWSVTVDGEAAEIEKANVGFMAVYVPAGKHTIRFNYRTPGFNAGLLISLLGAAALAAYVVLFAVYRRSHPDCCKAVNPEREALEAEWSEYDRLESEYLAGLAEAEAAESAQSATAAAAQAAAVDRSGRGGAPDTALNGGGGAAGVADPAAAESVPGDEMGSPAVGGESSDGEIASPDGKADSAPDGDPTDGKADSASDGDPADGKADSAPDGDPTDGTE